MRESDLKIRKLQKISKRLAVLLRIISFLLIISMVFLAYSFSSLLFPSERDRALLLERGYSLGMIRISVLWVFAGAACIIAMLFLLERILQEISEDHSPFAQKQVQRIRRIALLGLVNSLVSGFSSLLDNALAGNTSGGWQLNWPWLLFAAVVWCLSYVFDYGCLLQRESDETL